MFDLWGSLGFFVWPLGLFSVVAVFIIAERLIALRPSRVIPQKLVDDLVRGETAQDKTGSVGGRIVDFTLENKPDAEGVKAFAQLEVTRMERGLFLLDIVVAGAPLLGLLGTVWGLVEVFGGVSPETGIPEPGLFVQGIARALSTTMLGLIIAIVALIGNSYLNRRVDLLASRLNLCVERLIDLIVVAEDKAGEK